MTPRFGIYEDDELLIPLENQWSELWRAFRGVLDTVPRGATVAWDTETTLAREATRYAALDADATPRTWGQIERTTEPFWANIPPQAVNRIMGNE